jgi:hypothetical protein
MDPDEGASAWQRDRRGLVPPTTTDRPVPNPSIPAFGGVTPDTQRDYIRAVKKLAVFLGRSPDTATSEELRAFQLHLTATGVQPPTINATVTVLPFFFKVTLDRPEMTRHLVFVCEPRKLPRVLSPEEVLRLASRRARPIRPSRSQIRALAAADAGSSSRSSTPVATTGQQGLSSRSESIPHEREHDLARHRAHPEPVNDR